jgi:hypothetical protein
MESIPNYDLRIAQTFEKEDLKLMIEDTKN